MVCTGCSVAVFPGLKDEWRLLYFCSLFGVSFSLGERVWWQCLCNAVLLSSAWKQEAAACACVVETDLAGRREEMLP